MSDIKNEISRRRTFAIISHPDAGKTTLTEKLLLYGRAIQSAGSIKGKQNDKHAVSDWMEIEKKRGISITSSVMQFEYNGYCINILDTPGHQDFSEDTYRTLTAADSVVMVIDAAKGIEPQTRKLFKVCAMRHIPIFTFINKMDREARDSFELLDELESEFGIGTYPMNWPIGCGVNFRGVFDREKRQILTFADSHAGGTRIEAIECDINDTEKLDSLIGEYARKDLQDEIDLVDGAGYEFDLDLVRSGKLSPVFFGSALNNFGVEPFLENFLSMTTEPLPHRSGEEIIKPEEEKFSAFVFKIQANMNKAHRDRIAFMRICSGKFERSKEYFHVQGKKNIKLSRPQQMMAKEREIIDTAYAGDIIGVFDPGIFSIGDTVCEVGMKVEYAGIPTFAPEHFAMVEQIDSLKRKQFDKGINQIAQEGAIQMFFLPGAGMERVYVGVVGVLQFDVLKFRMESEYGVTYNRIDTPLSLVRFVETTDGGDLNDLNLMSATKHVVDRKGRDLLLFTAEYEINWALDKNENIILKEFSQMEEFE